MLSGYRLTPDSASPWSRLAGVLRVATAALAMSGPALAAQTSSQSDLVAIADSPKTSGTTCFDGQIDGPKADRIKRSVVEIGIVNRHANGEESLEWLGSGFIVSGSGTPDHPENKIVTAAHVIAPIGPTESIKVMGSDGILFGKASVVKANWKDNAAIGDVAAIAMTDFTDEATRKDFDNRPGIEIGPQSRHQYRTGRFGTTFGVTSGMSGGPVVNASGQAIGVVVGKIPNGQVSVSTPDFGETTIDPQTLRPRAEARRMDVPAPAFIIAITPEVLDVLGAAGAHIHRRDERSVMQVKALGAAHGGCTVVDGQVRRLDFKTLDDFRAPNSASPLSHYAHWEDSRRAMPYLLELLDEASTMLPTQKKAAYYAGDLRKYKDLKRVPYLADLDDTFDDMAAAVTDTPLADRLQDAASFLDSVWRQEEYHDPKLPLTKRITSALKLTF